MAECLSCSAPATLFLCQACIDEHRAALLSLVDREDRAGRQMAGLISNLEDAATRQVHLGGNVGGRPRRGDRPDPFEPDADDGKVTRQGRASNLLAEVHNTLGTILRDLCETRGAELPAGRRIDSQRIAKYLATHVHSIATDESAGQWKRDIDNVIRKIEKAVDRPPVPRFCGPCTHYVADDQHCGTLLYASRDAIETTCGACKTVHNIEELARNLDNRIAVMRFTSSEILMIMEASGSRIPETTWRRWRKDGRVKIRGYRRPDRAGGTRGAIGLARHGAADKPVYRLSEVRAVYRAAIKHSDALARRGITPAAL